MNITEREIDLIEKAAKRAGMVSLLNHGAASCVYSEGCNGVTQEHLMAFAREIALHCATALYQPNLEDAQGEIRALRATEAGLVDRVKELVELLDRAPAFFSHHDFDGEKLEFLQTYSALLEKKE